MGDRGELPKPGDVLAGKYEVVREIGEGGMASVFEGRHRRLDARVAIKVLRREVRAVPDVVTRFEREARAAVQLQSAHVARVFDVDLLDDGSPFMVMEYLEGCDLAQEVRRRGGLPPGESVEYVLGACHAMSEAHALGIIHRDLTPANIFLASCREGRVVKVLDFGISKVVSDASPCLTAGGSTFGTPLYMSPEQIRTPHLVDPRTDIWSLGVVLYELLAGCPPFEGESPAATVAAIAADAPVHLHGVRPDLPAALCAATMRALEKKPALRFDDIDAFAHALLPFGRDPIRSNAVSTAPTTVRTLRESAAPIAPEYPLLAVGGAALATIVALVSWGDGPTVVGAAHARLAGAAMRTTPEAIEHRASPTPSAAPSAVTSVAPPAASAPPSPTARPRSTAPRGVPRAAESPLPTVEPTPDAPAPPTSVSTAVPAEPPPPGKRVFRRTL